MDVDPEVYDLFRRGSRTYFFSSVFFPRNVRADVFTLYAFVRKADNFVDCIPQKREAFLQFRRLYESGLAGNEVGDVVISAFLRLMDRKGFDAAWVDAFLDAMEADLSVNTYYTLPEVEHYMYGSAEVVGLMMSAIFDLPLEAQESARLLGRAMQYINFIRDIEEDLALGRVYLPLRHAEALGLTAISESEARSKPLAFSNFVRSELERYKNWQRAAEKGFRYLPMRMRIPVATASEMYRWTGLQIERDPLIVFTRKVKPGVPRIILQAGQQLASCIIRTSPSIS